MIGRIVKEMKWDMGTNESAETKGKCCHGKEIGLMMSKDRGMSGPLYPKLSTCFEGARLTH